MNRQRLILFILVIIFLIAAVWSYISTPRLKTVSSLPEKSIKKSATVAQQSNVKKVSSADDGTKLNIEIFEKKPVEFKGYRRNIFKPLFVDVAKIVKPNKVDKKVIKPAKIAPPASVASQTPSTLIQPETAPLARFTFLGFLKKGSVKTIFLKNEKDIILVKKGDTIINRYEATDISDKALTLTVSDTGDEIIIPLIENKQLIAAKQ